MMKATYIISKSTNIDPSTLISKIYNKVADSGYYIRYNDDKTINFDNNIWGIGSRINAFEKVDGGKFQIITSEKETKLVFKYYVSFGPMIFLTIFLVIGGIIQDYHIIYLVVIFWLVFMFRVAKGKSAGEEMFEDMLL